MSQSGVSLENRTQPWSRRHKYDGPFFLMYIKKGIREENKIFQCFSIISNNNSSRDSVGFPKPCSSYKKKKLSLQATILT